MTTTALNAKISKNSSPWQSFHRVDVSTTSGSAAVFDWLPEEPTAIYSFDREMLMLERAVKLDNEAEFTKTAQQMNWSARPVENYLRAIFLALQVGSHLVARKLAQEGGKRFPDHPDMIRHARVLAPVTTLRTGLPAEPEIAANMNWLKSNREQYKGLWLALKNGTLIASSDSYQVLLKAVGNIKHTGILITRA